MPKAKTMVVSSYDPWISVKKFFTGWVYAVIPVTLAYSINFVETEYFLSLSSKEQLAFLTI